MGAAELELDEVLPPEQVFERLRGQAPPGLDILSVRRTYMAITVNAQFFAGPRALPPGYEINLGRNPARLDVRPETKTDAMVSWIDLLPSLIDLAGGKAPAGIDGRSFAGVLRGNTGQHRDRIFATQGVFVP